MSSGKRKSVVVHTDKQQTDRTENVPRRNCPVHLQRSKTSLRAIEVFKLENMQTKHILHFSLRSVYLQFTPSVEALI